MVTYPSTHGVFEEKILIFVNLYIIMVDKFIWMVLILNALVGIANLEIWA